MIELFLDFLTASFVLFGFLGTVLCTRIAMRAAVNDEWKICAVACVADIFWTAMLAAILSNCALTATSIVCR